MKPKVLLSAALPGVAAGALVPRAFKVAANNGFPNPNSQQQQLVIANEAGGKLPNSPPPTSLGAGTTTAFQLIAFNELFETAFFSSLLNNITQGVPGYGAPAGAVPTLRAILAVSALTYTYQCHPFNLPTSCSKKSSTL